MKRILLILLVALMMPWLALAQSPQGRLPKTIVADVLAQMPAKNVQIYNQMMNDLISSGEIGLEILTSGMLPESKNDNTAVSYAIGGLAYYVTTPGKDKEREQVNKAFAKALDKAQDRDVKAFFIRHLQIVGQDDALLVLKPYIFSKELSEEAVAAITKIATPNAKAMIESEFDNIPDKSVAAYAAGNLGLTSKESAILSWLGSSDVKLQKSSLYALARIGGKKSSTAIANAAKAVNYTFEPTGAMDSYFTILRKNPNTKELNSLLKNSDPNVRSSAIQILADATGKKTLPIVIKAMNDSDRSYRNTALNAAIPYADNNFYGLLLEKVPMDKLGTPLADLSVVSEKSLGAEQVADILNFVGLQGLEGATKRITPYLTSPQKELRVAAITALARIDEADGRSALISRLTDTDAEKISEVKSGLSWCKGVQTSALAAMMPAASEAGKVAAIELLASRQANDYSAMLFDLTKVDGSVGEAAYAALPMVVANKDLKTLCDMLTDSALKSTPAKFKYVPEAISTLLSHMPKDKAFGAIKPYLNKSYLYYQTLVGIGSPEALSFLKDVAANDSKNKNYALLNITKWNDMNASSTLYDIFSKPAEYGDFSNQALSGYIRVMKNAKFNEVQRFIHLRKALNVATKTDQKNTILMEMANCNDFNAIILAGKYLSDPATELAAGNIVLRTVSKDKDYKFWGDETKEILKKFLEVRTGGDAAYDKAAVQKYLNEAPSTKGFVAIFNGKDLTGWKGLVQNPIARGKMTPAELTKNQEKADEVMRKGWEVRNGVLYFTGQGDNLCTEKMYGDFEMYVDWLIQKDGDAGIYLRGAPQVQIWDTCRRDVGAQVGSGGLYNNSHNPRNPLKLADNAIGDWNTFYIKMVGERVSVYLNGILVVDNVIMENYWNRKMPIFPIEQIELQAHGTEIAYRDIYVKELPKQEPFKLSAEEQTEGYKVLFDGISMNEWVGNTKDYITENGTITLYPKNGGGGNLYTKDEYADFIFRFEFMLTPAANNGLGIRTPKTGDAAYVGTELQILDNEHSVYKDLEAYQYHGSAYGIIAAKRGYLKPVGEWNYQEVVVKGNHVKVTLNGTVILDGDMDEASKNGTIDGKDHPGLKNTKGHIAFLGHGSEVKFRNIRIKELK